MRIARGRRSRRPPHRLPVRVRRRTQAGAHASAGNRERFYHSYMYMVVVERISNMKRIGKESSVCARFLYSGSGARARYARMCSAKQSVRCAGWCVLRSCHAASCSRHGSSACLKVNQPRPSSVCVCGVVEGTKYVAVQTPSPSTRERGNTDPEREREK